jgi:hypothetical protein
MSRPFVRSLSWGAVCQDATFRALTSSEGFHWKDLWAEYDTDADGKAPAPLVLPLGYALSPNPLPTNRLSLTLTLTPYQSLSILTCLRETLSSPLTGVPSDYRRLAEPA